MATGTLGRRLIDRTPWAAILGLRAGTLALIGLVTSPFGVEEGLAAALAACLPEGPALPPPAVGPLAYLVQALALRLLPHPISLLAGQALAGLLSYAGLLALYPLVMRLWDTRTALLTVALTCLCPWLAWPAASILPDALLFALLMAAAASWTSWADTSRPRHRRNTVILLALAGLVRPWALVVSLIFLATQLARSAPGHRGRALALGLMAVAPGLVWLILTLAWGAWAPGLQMLLLADAARAAPLCLLFGFMGAWRDQAHKPRRYHVLRITGVYLVLTLPWLALGLPSGGEAGLVLAPALPFVMASGIRWLLQPGAKGRLQGRRAVLAGLYGAQALFVLLPPRPCPLDRAEAAALMEPQPPCGGPQGLGPGPFVLPPGRPAGTAARPHLLSLSLDRPRPGGQVRAVRALWSPSRAPWQVSILCGEHQAATMSLDRAPQDKEGRLVTVLALAESPQPCDLDLRLTDPQGQGLSHTIGRDPGRGASLKDMVSQAPWLILYRGRLDTFSGRP